MTLRLSNRSPQWGGPRVASVCSGGFLLGALGLLDGRRATTHWMATDRLARAYPRAKVDSNALFVADGRVWTAAGVASGIDLALALVGRDLGPQTALAVARRLVLHLVRPGGQSQFSDPLSLQARSGPSLGALIPWLETRLDRGVSVAAMAEAMGMSERSFHRRCVADLGLSPGKLVARLRLDRARALMSDPTIPVQSVATQSGFSDIASFSKAFSRRFGASPSTIDARLRSPLRAPDASSATRRTGLAFPLSPPSDLPGLTKFSSSAEAGPILRRRGTEPFSEGPV